MSRFKEYEGKTVNVFWKNGTQSIMDVDYVRGAFVKFKLEKYPTSEHLIDDMEEFSGLKEHEQFYTGSSEPRYLQFSKEEIEELEKRNSTALEINKIKASEKPLNQEKLNEYFESNYLQSFKGGVHYEPDRDDQQFLNHNFTEKEEFNKKWPGAHLLSDEFDRKFHSPIDQIFVEAKKTPDILNPNVDLSDFECIKAAKKLDEEFTFPDMKPKRKAKPKKLPRAYQRYSEGGIWYVHYGNGMGINARGQGDTLEQAYLDWQEKHRAKQENRKRNGN